MSKKEPAVTPPARPRKKASADEETPTAVVARPKSSEGARACPVCGTLRVGLSDEMPCPVDGYALGDR